MTYRRDYRATMDEQDDRSRSLMGRRGGTSANAGRRKRTFTATAPDGTTLTQGTFQLTGRDSPFTMGAFASKGKWYHNGVWGGGDVVPEWAQARPAIDERPERVLLPAVEVVK